MNRTIYTITVLGVYLCLGFWSMALGNDLESDLRELDSLRNGFSTDFKEVTRRGEKLLAEYYEPEAQAKIYYQLAHVEGQSGLQRPEIAMKYIEKGLKLPLGPDLRPQLYMYWGNAIEVQHRGVHGNDLHGPRREAAIKYLLGSKQSLDLQSQIVTANPDQNEETSNSSPRTAEGLLRPGPDNKAIGAKAHSEWRNKKRIERLSGFDEAFEIQVVYLYSRRPFNTNELKKLAQEILKDYPETVQKLIDHVENAIQERTNEEVNRQLNLSMAALNPSDHTIAGSAAQHEPKNEAIALETETKPSASPIHAVDRKKDPLLKQHPWIVGIGVVLLLGLGAVVVRKRQTGHSVSK